MSHRAPHLPHEVRAKEIECFKHYCRECRMLDFVPRGPRAPTPRCCNKWMAYLGVVVARPGRDESIKKS